jgi:hypothetical protein
VDKETLNTIDDLIRHKNKAIMELNLCAITLARLAPVFGIKTGIATLSDEELKEQELDEVWRNLLVLYLPQGQVTWPLHAAEVYLIKEMAKLPNYVYDGHTTQEKYARLLKWAESWTTNTHNKRICY